jgi:type I restriction enzyme, S subunit
MELSLLHNAPRDWKRTTLGDIVARGGGSIQTGPFGSQLHASDYVADGVPSIMPVNIGDNRLIRDGIACISEEDAQRLSKHIVRKGDIIYSRRGDVERRALVRDAEDGWFCGTGCLKVQLGDGVILPEFAAFYLGHPEVRGWIGRHAVGITMPNLNTSIMEAVPFLVPPLNEQRAIAGVLSSLDDKIEQDRRTARALERLARAIFRAWFVDFEPVKAKAAGATAFRSMPQDIFDALSTTFIDSEIGPIPEGWAPGRLGENCKINECTVRSSEIKGDIEYVDIASVTAGQLSAVQRTPFHEAPSRARRRVRHGDTIWSCVRPNRRSYLFVHTPPQNRIVSTGFAVLSPGVFGPSFLHQTTIQPEFVDYLVANADGSAYPAVRPEHFASATVIVPRDDLLAAFEELTMPGRDLIASTHRESGVLAELRDLLLPKLLSGAVRVRNFERIAGEVAE